MRRGVRLREIGAHESRVLPKSVELALRAARGRGFGAFGTYIFNQDAAGTLIDSKRRPSAQKEDRTDETYNSSS